MLTGEFADWRRTTNPDAECQILSLFADDTRAPYSLHNFVKHGEVACGKYPGEWFGPSATARCIQYVTPNLVVSGISRTDIVLQGLGEPARELIEDILDR